MKQERVLITGGAGYIGSILARLLLRRGYRVRVLDRLSFGGESLSGLIPESDFEFMLGDIRKAETVTHALEKVDMVVHLAAIVGDPACNDAPEEAREIMDLASRKLYEMAVQNGVSRFVFASTCSNYGIMEDEEALLDENAVLAPQSLYAKLKVGFEQFLLDQKQEGITRTILRFATVYGCSPRMRFDLTVNHFTRDLTLGKQLEVFYPEAWRPYCHVEDLARSVCLVLEQEAGAMDGKVYNVGDSHENYTKRSLLEAITTLVPEADFCIRDEQEQDSRNYRVDFGRIRREMGFRITKRVPDGIREVYKLIRSGLLADPFDARYRNT